MEGGQGIRKGNGGKLIKIQYIHAGTIQEPFVSLLIYCSCRIGRPGAVEMVQWLGALKALLENPGSIPSSYMATHNCL